MKIYLAEFLIGGLIILFALRTDLLKYIRNALRKWFHAAPETIQEKPTPLYFILTAVLFCLFAFLLFYKTDEIPIAYHADEAGMAYDAKSLANYGVDRFLYRNPVYLINFGGGQSVLYAYLAALCIKIFGYSVLSVRIPAILLSILSAAIFVITIRREYGNASAVILALLFCGLPFSIMHSRWGLDCYLFFPMMIISGCFLYAAIRTNKIWLFSISGIFFGITLYSYAISYVFIPLFLGILFIYLLYTGQIKWNRISAIGAPLFVIAIPLLLQTAVNYGIIDEIRTSFISMPKLPVFRQSEIGFRNIITNLAPNKNNIFYRILVYDFNPSNVIIKFGTLYYFTFPVIFWGFVLCTKRCIDQIKNKFFSLDLLMVWLFFSAFAVSLTLDGINVNRACEIYIPLIYFLCIGFLAIYRLRKSAAITACLIFIAFSISFLHYYFTEYPKEMPGIGILNSVDDMRDALNYAASIDSEKQITIIHGDRPQPYIYTLLALDIDPYTFDREKNQSGGWVLDFEKYHFRTDFFPNQYSVDSIYVFMEPNKIPENMDTYGLDHKDFNVIRVYYESGKTE